MKILESELLHFYSPSSSIGHAWRNSTRTSIIQDLTDEYTLKSAELLPICIKSSLKSIISSKLS